MDENEIDEVAKKYKNVLRDNTNELFTDLHRTGVPILVFSAGIGNSVVAVLKATQLLYANVKVVL